MAPPILQLDDIGLSFGGEPLLEGAALQIELGQRICLVGRNGSGKSTLLRIAAGEIEPQDGEVFRQPGLTFSHLVQEPDFAEGERTIDHVEKGLNATDRPQAAERLMEELGLDPQALAAQLSGGEQRRVALARALVGRPDLLLLDEPTNHLDLPTIEWLEGKLKGQPGAIVMISHDRRFLEEMTNSVVWLERGRTRRLAQGFKAFEEWRETLLAEEEKAHHRLGRKVKREEDWLRYGVTARRKRNVRRLAALKSAREEFKSARGGPARAVLDPVIATRSGTFVLEAKNVSFGYGDRTIVQDFDLRMHRGDRIGIVGANGAGKTTLLGLLTGTLKPDEGRVRHGSNLALAALDQDRSSLDGAQTLGDFLASGHGDEGVAGSQPRHVSTLMKDFLFDPAQLRQPIATLSGGERGRLMLARLLTRPSNFLILDEPTNDLDMETLDLLQEKIAEYAGTVLLISHDRDFLDRTVTAIVAPEGNGKWRTYAGGYSDMVAQRGKAPFAADKASPTQNKPSRKSGEEHQARTEKPAEKLSFGQKFRLDNLPGEMEKLRTEIAAAESLLARPDFFARDPHGFNDAASALDQNRTRLEEAENEWLELEILRESLGSI